MGVYDIVKVPCPKCKKIEYFQSKSGDCLLNLYLLSACPDDVLFDVNRHAPYRCSRCKTDFSVDITTKKSIMI